MGIKWSKEPVIKAPVRKLRRFKSYPIYLSVWRNWIARQTSNLKVAGSNPVMDKYLIRR